MKIFSKYAMKTASNTSNIAKSKLKLPTLIELNLRSFANSEIETLKGL